MSTAPPPAPGHQPSLPAVVPATPDPAEAPVWRPWTAWVGLIGGFGGALAGAILITVVALAFGAQLDDTPPAVNILATVVQDLSLVAAAYVMARMSARPRPADFGLRPTALRPAIGWALLAWGAFFVFTAAWVAAVGAKQQDDALPQSLGVDRSTVALVAVAVLVCVIAPIAEELFFRGFFFTALRPWRGVLPAAIVTGLVFGAIHAGSADLAFLLPLAAFGFALCLLYVRTGSLYPCVALHAANNCTAFGVSRHWTAPEIVLTVLGAYVLIAVVFALVARAARTQAAAPLAVSGDRG